MPLLADLIHNLYDSKYDKFFIALGTHSVIISGFEADWGYVSYP